MKKIMIFLGMMVASTIMFAQPRVDPMERAAKQAEKMKTELGLDEVQFNAVKAINEEYAGKLNQIRRDSTLSREEKHTQMRTFHQERDAAFKKVLTAEQHKKLAANRSEQKNKHRAKMAKHQGAHAERIQKELSLTEDQAAQLKGVNREFGQKVRALRSDSTVAEEDRKAKIQQVRQEYQSKIKTILTDEQVKKWETLKSERKRRKL
jgi:Spy/CpxP family protein refolding chaperone